MCLGRAGRQVVLSTTRPDRLNCVVTCIALTTAIYLFFSRFVRLLWDDDDELWQPDVCVRLLSAHQHAKEQRLDPALACFSRSVCVCPSLQFFVLFISAVQNNPAFRYVPVSSPYSPSRSICCPICLRLHLQATF